MEYLKIINLFIIIFFLPYMLYCIIAWFTKYIYTQVEQNILVLNLTFILKAG